MNDIGQLVAQTASELGFASTSGEPVHRTMTKAILAVIINERPTFSTSGGTVMNKTKKQREFEALEVRVLCGVIADAFRLFALTPFGVEETIKEHVERARNYLSELRSLRTTKGEQS